MDLTYRFFVLYSVAVVFVKSASKNLVLTITDPRGKKLETLRDQTEMRHRFAAFYSGNYQMCIQNMNNKQDEMYTFSLNTGVQATDYSNIVTKKHLTGVELQAQKIKDSLDMIRGEMDGLRITEDGLKVQNEKIKNRVVIFGVVSIIVMLLSTYLQVTYLKNFFRYKKII